MLLVAMLDVAFLLLCFMLNAVLLSVVVPSRVLYLWLSRGGYLNDNEPFTLKSCI
jgi:hypothetical protein